MPTVSPVTLQPHSLDHFTVPSISEIRQAMERLTLEKRAMRTLGRLYATLLTLVCRVDALPLIDLLNISVPP